MKAILKCHVKFLILDMMLVSLGIIFGTIGLIVGIKEKSAFVIIFTLLWAGLSLVVFRTWRELDPESISQTDLSLTSDLYWKKEGAAPSTQSSSQSWIDFRELEHVYQLLNYLSELEDAALEADISSNLSSLLRTLQFYIDHAELSDI